jgi:hypothetical protein
MRIKSTINICLCKAKTHRAKHRENAFTDTIGVDGVKSGNETHFMPFRLSFLPWINGTEGSNFHIWNTLTACYNKCLATGCMVSIIADDSTWADIKRVYYCGRYSGWTKARWANSKFDDFTKTYLAMFLESCCMQRRPQTPTVLCVYISSTVH